MGGGPTANRSTKTVVVLGAAYGGCRAAQILAAGLPEDWRLIVIDRNSSLSKLTSADVYVMPRFAVLPGHEYKSMVPYTGIFATPTRSPNHIVLKAHVVSMRPGHVTLSKSFPEYGFPSETIPFDFCLYSLGAHLPAPVDLWGTNPWSSVADGLNGSRHVRKVTEKAPTVLVVGGGALGVQFATDIKAVHPATKVRKTLETQEVDLILGERLDLSSVDLSTNSGKKTNAKGQRIVRTVTGREIAADLLLLCVGQTPNSAILAAMDPSTVNTDTKLARVQRTMQLTTVPVPHATADEITLVADVEEQLKVSSLTEAKDLAKPDAPSPASSRETYSNIFVVGDCADAFGAIPAGHTAYNQGEVAARNIIRLVKKQEDLPQSEEEAELEEYAPGAPAIKVSLGLTHSVYQVGPEVSTKDDGVPDLQAPLIWPFFGIKVEKDEDMYD
ncbi:hypothetical protein BKA70DRAFT_1293604 [Coprinopsis sp. MPI-PUGE-AT-0042]|nr:hypothetical protein BKA70DRAFT_1293604 [Coprinopsis sp. MPI-PUGE-AT-0042]